MRRGLLNGGGWQREAARPPVPPVSWTTRLSLLPISMGFSCVQCHASRIAQEREEKGFFMKAPSTLSGHSLRLIGFPLSFVQIVFQNGRILGGRSLRLAPRFELFPFWK
jgi:hypothetical protein